MALYWTTRGEGREAVGCRGAGWRQKRVQGAKGCGSWSTERAASQLSMRYDSVLMSVSLTCCRCCCCLSVRLSLPVSALAAVL